MIELSAAPMTWVTAGDSITQASTHTRGARGWVEHLHERVRRQLDRRTDIVVNTGVSGWTSADVLGSYHHLIGRFSPDILSISLGTNDAHAGAVGLDVFHSGMREIITRTPGARIVLQTPVPTGPAARATHPDLPAYCQAVRDIAHDTGSLLVDHEAYWLARFPDGDPSEWLDDPIHPKALGHLHMANHTLRALGLGELIHP
ncbi:SGNH/GDSL hydrolase family protein [Kitasatospora purpeofusca]|uniref:SGNH/GDSL hydrolase family protein n=1 Tax=Kitasatospora purpeofusca TaxID=67352 RepID=UPI00224CCDFF|nr:SGNH/GDSL hydrolase family protein [Kitasatospora purpeofusca]MCX4682823.1 SGNH/GDSL hydrolase family protein [Kitasatospora purpeofusca]